MVDATMWIPICLLCSFINLVLIALGFGHTATFFGLFFCILYLAFIIILEWKIVKWYVVGHLVWRTQQQWIDYMAKYHSVELKEWNVPKGYTSAYDWWQRYTPNQK